MKLLRLLLLSVLSFAITSPALAAFNIPGCPPETFTIVARQRFASESGPLSLTGNVLVTQGEAALGAHNRLVGTLIAPTIKLSTGALVDTCIADVITGPGTCTTVLGTFAAAPAACKVFDFIPPIVDVCVNAALLVNVPAGQTETLSPGCYGIVRVGQDATLNLEPGVYFIRNLRVIQGGTLEGAFPGPRSRLLVKEGITLLPTARVLHVDVLTALLSGQAITIGNAVTLLDVQVIAAGAGVHVHTGSVVDSSAIAGVRVISEPATFREVESPVVCQCPPGFHFAHAGSCTLGDPISCALARSCVPD